MSLIWILIISVCSSKYALCDYITTSTSGTWTQMMNNCTLATPSIIYGLNNTVGIQADFNFTEGNQLWVGYTQDYEAFRFIGCVEKKAVHITKSNSLFDIGDCYSSCGTANYFGVSVDEEINPNNTSCHCISGVVEWNITSCQANFIGSEFTFGGPSTVALYKTILPNISSILRSNTNWSNTEANCFCYFNPVKNKYQWVNCTTAYSSLCSTSINGIVTDKSEMSTTWKEAADECLKTNQYLTTYHPNITTNDTAQQWTATIRTMAIVSTTGSELYKDSMFRKYGYIERRGNVSVLKFRRDNSSYNALCLTGTDRDIVPKTDGSSGNVGAYVGTSVAVVVLIAVVVVVIVVVIIRKRKKPSDDKKVNNMRPNITYDTQNNQGNLEPSRDQNDDYNEIEDIVTSSDDYDVLKDSPRSQHDNSNNQYSGLHKKQFRHEVKAKAAMHNDYDVATDPTHEHNNRGLHDYFVLEKDQDFPKKESKKQDNSGYDFAIEAGTCTELPREREAIEHCYNTTSTTGGAECDNYDHISKILDQFSGEQPYDTTLQWGAGKEIDPNYDHTGAHQGHDEPYSTCGKKTPIEKEDLYNKLVKPS